MVEFSALKKEIEDRGVQLVAVSKTRSVSEIMSLYNQGQRHFGENRVQELVQKKDELPSDIHWHLIGQLQKNKVKYISPFVHCIQSVDSLSLAEKINKEAQKHQRKINILLQIKIGQEASKSGYDIDILKEEIQQLTTLSNLSINGAMGIGTFTSDEDVTRAEFNRLKGYYDLLKAEHFSTVDSFKEVSMGMSGDYRLAMDCGSTVVRIGSLLFGRRG